MIDAAPQVDVEQLMARIREEVARRKQHRVPAAENLAPLSANETPAPVAPGLAELLRYEGAECVAQAYRTLLRREPEPAALEGRTLTLESGGNAAKIDMFRELCASDEGRGVGAAVRGLTVPYLLGELLGGDDAEFVARAYQTLLGRTPDAEGLQTYLTCLREYALSRMDTLRVLRFSEEGQVLAVEVAGLQPPVSIQQLRKIDSLKEGGYPVVVEDEVLKAAYSLSALLGGDDAGFVTGAYQILLGREPDEEGQRTYQEQLATGTMSRIDVLRDLRFSVEGQALNVEVTGLLPLPVEQPITERLVPEPWSGRAERPLIDSNNPEVDVDELMARIRQEKAPPPVRTLSALLGGDEVEFITGAYRVLLGREPDEEGRRVYQERLAAGTLSRIDVLRTLRFSTEGKAFGSDIAGLTPLPGDPFPPIAVKGDYQLGELLGYPDERFLYNAYQAILRREPDQQGLPIYLSRLRQGSLSKIDILGGLRFSAEGRRAGVRIHGLLAPWLLHAAYRVPVLGSLMALVSVLLRPGKIIQRLRSLEAHSELADQRRYEIEQWRGESDQLKRLADAKANQHELATVAAQKVDFHEFTAVAAQKVDFHEFSAVAGRLETEIRQLKMLADAKANQHELATVAAQKVDFEEFSTVTEPFTTELQQLKALADVKANEIEVKEIREQVSQLRTTFHQAALEDMNQLRINLRSALQGKADMSEISVLQLRLKQAMERIETRADQQTVTELQDRLTEIHALVDSRAEQQAITDLQGQIGILAESKAEKSELTGLTNHFAGLMQTHVKATAETLETKADQATLTAVQQTLETKADQATLTAKSGAEALRPELVDLRQQIQNHQHSIVDQQRRLALLLEEARKRLPEPLDAQQLATFSGEVDHVLDAMYVGFEDDFRGVRAEIKRRLSAYLPLLPTGIGSSFAPAVDLGCGRGEWLELLKEHDLIVTGVDLNRVMAESCREQGLAVVEADALTYLREQSDGSLGLITGFHIIEHLPLRALIALFDEALRVLKPGGMVIFETPNPENLVVGACNFYMDPTHRNPMPPAMTQFLVEARGFVRVEIRRMNQQLLNDPLRLLESGMPGAAELNPLIQMAKEHYFAAPDYAVVAYKA